MPFPGTVQSGGNRIDVTTLTPFNNELNGLTSTAGVFSTLLSITGKGFLDNFSATIDTAVAIQVRVTVDGVVKVLLGNSSANTPVGVLSKTDVYNGATSGNYGIRNPGGFVVITSTPSAIKPYPTTDGSNGLIVMGDSKIYFYNSLLLEILTNGTSRYRYSGAYKS